MFVESKATVPQSRHPSSSVAAPELHALLLGPPVLTLAVAESMTSGRVQAAIGAVSGASRYFLGGVTAYAVAAKREVLGVPEELLSTTNVATPKVAAALAFGALGKFGSDLAIGTTGFAEPDPAHGFPEPGAFWAIARGGSGGRNVIRQGRFRGVGLNRVQVQDAVAHEVLEALADYLRGFRAAERTSKFA